ncbi:MAG TPA: hypothetical protein VNB29_01430 [Chthoniobacterales bacterium]|nr:hypothetical protein [Chthoniobacterales bacterium]
MNSVKEILSDHQALAGSLRILTGATYSGKRAIYISGSPEGFRLLAQLLNRQADAAENEFTKFERDEGELFFTTTDSVDIFELHNHHPAAHHPRLE